MVTDKNDESTRDIICIDFQFGLRSYGEEVSHIKQMRKDAAEDPDKLIIIDELAKKIEERKDLYKKISKDEIRRIFYEDGVPITYTYTNKKTNEVISETIRYKMLYRNPSKAKQGNCMFIRDELYDAAYDWLTMGIGKRLPAHNAKIVEISAYAPLSTSAIEGTVHIPVEDVLILRDQDSFFHTIADVVRAEDYQVVLRNKKTETRKRCTVTREEVDVKNTLWDGMALMETTVMPSWCNGMALLRNHFFKACAFRTRIQQFFMDYCLKNNIDYETYEIVDMFGCRHYAKDIKMITTDNAIKWKKFADLIGGDLVSAYEYWKKRVNCDNSIWGIVKTDHKSKLGNVQQMSYQMINTLPCSKEDIEEIAKTSIEYIETLKNNNDEFEKYLRKNATVINHYEMLSDLRAWNPAFENSKMWKADKASIINSYVARLRKGKITVNGDNLTVCGNPYALLLYTVGEDWNDDPTLVADDGVIQVYAPRFNDGEYLCGIRNPHNSANNIGYFKNVIHPLMDKYFEFSKNIMAVNCIHTDVQSRMNGEDFDSDFNFVTNQPQMVEAARIAYRDYPTVVNEVGESGMSYDNTMAEYARMDSAMQSAQKAIGGSSDTAQLAQSYYWTKVNRGELDDDCRQYYENTVILAICAQLAIDGCKREFQVDVNNDIARIRAQACMKKEHDFPAFMRWTREVPLTKNGKERSYNDIKKDKNKIKSRIDNGLECPMNWLQDCLDKIQGSDKSNCIPTSQYFLKIKGRAHSRQMSAIRKLVEEYDYFVKNHLDYFNDIEGTRIITEYHNNTLSALKAKSISQTSMNRLIETSLGMDGRVNTDKKYRKATKLTRKMLNLLYQYNKEKFLLNFKTAENLQ